MCFQNNKQGIFIQFDTFFPLINQKQSTLMVHIGHWSFNSYCRLSYKYAYRQEKGYRPVAGADKGDIYQKNSEVNLRQLNCVLILIASDTFNPHHCSVKT